MERWACVDVEVLPLQLLLREHPSWAAHPVAVVDADHPQGTVLWLNHRARCAHVRSGMRFGEALGLCPTLRAAEVPKDKLARAVESLHRLVLGFSPAVEPVADEPGVFLVDARGLVPLFPSLHAWARALEGALGDRGWRARVVVGSQRYRCYAVARAMKGRGALVFCDAEAERQACHRVPLSQLGIQPQTREALAKLGVCTVGELLRLPASGLSLRFGPELYRWHRLLGSDALHPIEARIPVDRPSSHVELEYEERDVERLMLLLEPAVSELLMALEQRGQGLQALRLNIARRRLPADVVELRPAEPTLELAQILSLLRLRLGTWLDATSRQKASGAVGVTAVDLWAIGAPLSHEQRDLLAERSRRDPMAAERAFARLRALFGDDSVVCAQLAAGHLPEARFRWEPLEHLQRARPRPGAIRPLIRRIYAKPLPLFPPARRRERWLPRGSRHGSVVRVVGPYLTSGAWWHRQIERDYYFIEYDHGGLGWVYFDRRTRRWLQQGTVE